MWSDFVVVRAPDGHGCSGLVQGLKPALIEVLVAELAIEAFDVAVLHRAAWLNQNVANAVGLSPGHECSACELRAIVRTHCLRIPAQRHACQRALRYAGRRHGVQSGVVETGDQAAAGAADRRNGARRRGVVGSRATAWGFFGIVT